jgi:drug/metabolite transporter (DMT)-like permease
MQTRTIKNDVLLLTAAFIWGTAFVAQRKGMEHVGPLTYNAFRFALGVAVLLPVIFCFRLPALRADERSGRRLFIMGGSLAGLVLFAGATLQQMGLVYTTAGKAGFITGLYVVIVPVIGIFLGHRIGFSVWAGAGLAAVGLYFLSVTKTFSVDQGDMLVLLSAFFWAVHVLLIGHFARRADPFCIACIQFFVCSLLSFFGAGLTEEIALQTVCRAAGPILYGGVLSVGIAYSLQVVSQRTCPPAHAAIILSLEAVFAALAGWVVLGETLRPRNILGCVLMLSGMLVVQLVPLIKKQKHQGKIEIL